MNELELKTLWQTSNEKIENNLFISQVNTIEISRLKIVNLLNSMKPVKLVTLIIGIFWVGIGAFILSNIYVNAYSEANKYFLFSATIQVLLTAMALFIYIYQLIEINQIEIYEPVLKVQEKLAHLRMATLWSAKILFLQLPVWTTFWWNETMFSNWNILQWAMTAIITLLFTIIAIWLFFSIKIENKNKTWFKWIFNGREWTPLLKSIELLDNINEYKK
ncbi:MAG: hypothetical protein IT216_02975 [Saprospiraceae bacterium]|jgi:hypothetical protein|nr:hypothetical protein [Saprospiraceae bacterium]WKZ62530.1 MAG: hypothetical protein QY315_12245 [Saprospiraceae bacterium]